MLVFIDESGDPGFKLGSGSTPLFVAAMVMFETTEAASATQELIDKCEARRCHRGEFKFSKCCDEVRDGFCTAVRDCDFKIRAIVVKKDIIRSPNLRANKERFYQYFVRSMMMHSSGKLQNARVTIDGSGDREFRRELGSTLRKQLGQGVIKDLRFKDSQKDTLVQLADMCAGAIHRSYRTDRPSSDRWRKIIRPRIDDIWQFE